jgi:hypothetical protein
MSPDHVESSLAEGAPGLAPFETWVSTTQDCRKGLGALTVLDDGHPGSRKARDPGHPVRGFDGRIEDSFSQE